MIFKFNSRPTGFLQIGPEIILYMHIQLQDAERSLSLVCFSLLQLASSKTTGSVS